MHIHSTTDFLIFVAKYSWDVSRDIIGHAVFRLCSRSPSFPQPLRPFGILIPQDHDLESESQTKSMANENHIIIPQTNYIYIPQQKYYESATSQHNHRNLLLAINEGVDFDCPLPPTGRP